VLHHLLPALQRLDRLLVRAVAAARAAYGSEAAGDPHRGLYIGEPEVDRLLARPPGQPVLCDESSTSALVSLPDDSSLLGRLARTFDLAPFDAEVVLITLAPELDLRYARLYAYLQDDVTKKRPSVDLALNLLAPSAEARLTLRHRFLPSAPLLRHHLLQLLDDPSHAQPPLLSKYLKLDERVVGHLLGSDDPDPRLAPYTSHHISVPSLEALCIPPETQRRLALLFAKPMTADERLLVYVQGPAGVGKATAVAASCANVGRRLLVLDGERLAAAEEATFATLVAVAAREAGLRNAVLYWDRFDTLLGDEKVLRRGLLARALADGQGVAFLAGAGPWEPVPELAGVPLAWLDFPRPDASDRARLWEVALDGEGSLARGAAVATLAGRFRLTGGQIHAAAQSARDFARWRGPKGSMTADDLATACRLHSNRRLATLARKVTPHYAWGDIVLPTDRLQQLRDVCGYVTYRALVYDEWGFDHKLSLGKGLNVLFAGPSGTGKTMAAEIIAGELGLDLYKIDLATVVSKYIGETEKNLALIFAEAETSNAILFFDEADALFGKRSDVRDSHDRYANVEIAYLLQRMEEYEGVVILATNLRKNMDEAFVRRMHFTIEFPFPGEVERRRIWEGIWPADLPRSGTLDLDVMARRFEVAGGSIRNIALAAAFLAAADGQTVTMQHLLRATQREYQKMGKVVMEGAFWGVRPEA
jgi:MoxR-like ATPase